MSLPKVLNVIDKRLARIEAALGIDGEGELSPQGIKWIGRAQQAEPEPETPDEVAARLGYGSYVAREIIERAGSLTADERAALAQFERANENRITVVRALEAE